MQLLNRQPAQLGVIGIVTSYCRDTILADFEKSKQQRLDHRGKIRGSSENVLNSPTCVKNVQGWVPCVQITSHLKCITCVHVSMYLRRRANSHDLSFLTLGKISYYGTAHQIKPLEQDVKIAGRWLSSRTAARVSLLPVYLCFVNIALGGRRRADRLIVSRPSPYSLSTRWSRSLFDMHSELQDWKYLFSVGRIFLCNYFFTFQ